MHDVPSVPASPENVLHISSAPVDAGAADEGDRARLSPVALVRRRKDAWRRLQRVLRLRIARTLEREG